LYDSFYMGAGHVSVRKFQRQENDTGHNTEAYDAIDETGFLLARSSPLSTFSIDVDSASYSNVRRLLKDGTLPPAGAVRIEELINYFGYDYPQPKGSEPFARKIELGRCPWNQEHRLLHIGLSGRRLDPGKMPPRNLVFLLDVSGSMSSSNKLPLLKKAFAMLVDQLGENDKISIVVYAGASGMVLAPTSGSDKQRILAALGKLHAGGSTNGAAGIQLAYQTARQNFQIGAVNRVILATDGDFNVGTTSQSELISLIETQREFGVFLTVLGLGSGNLKDSTMEKLADRGNGNYAYLDNLAEARKVLVKEAGGTLVTIAKDVKIQIEFNPSRVKAYRLIGYENRMLKARDFADDRKDAGEIGAGHTVTALYELVPVGAKTEIPGNPALEYQTKTELSAAAASDSLLTLELRYKAPLGIKSKLIREVVKDGSASVAASDDFEFSAAVAMFGMLMRNSEYKGSSSYALAKELAQGSLGPDAQDYRREFLGLIDQAASLSASTR